MSDFDLNWSVCIGEETEQALKDFFEDDFFNEEKEYEKKF